MRVLKDIEELKDLRASSVSIGNFDGLHLGHQAIIKKLTSLSPNLVVTFDPHPREILSHQNNVRQTFKFACRLTTVEEKLALFEELNVDNLFILKFDQKLARMPASQFVHWLLVDHIKPEEVVIGYNHRFGKSAQGDFELLVHMGANFGFRVTRVPPVFLEQTCPDTPVQTQNVSGEQNGSRNPKLSGIEGFPVSSSWIRTTLTEGNVELASRLLGRPYSISSYVIPGKKRGRALSYPTANLKLPSDKLIPKNGVYAVWITLPNPATRSYPSASISINNRQKLNSTGRKPVSDDNHHKKLKGMMCIGEKPTFKEGFGIEVHILDFKENLLNQQLKIEFVKYLRPNRAFKNPQALKTQLKIDESTTRKT